MRKKTLYITSGAPGAGKTTFVDQRIEALGGVHIARDKIRTSLLKPGDYYFKNEKKVLDTFIKEAQKAIDNPFGETDIYLDATHLNSRSRNKVLNRLNLNNVKDVIILWFNIPTETLYERNLDQEGKERVPMSAIERMVLSMDVPNIYDNPRCTGIWRIDKEGWIDTII